VNLKANAVDAEVARVEFLVAGEVVGSDMSAPYSVPWDSKLKQNGPVEIRARATDASANVGQSGVRTINGDNTKPNTRSQPVLSRPCDRCIGHVQVQVERGDRREVPVQARRPRVEELRQPEALHGDLARHSHVPGACDRPGRKRRPDAGQEDLAPPLERSVERVFVAPATQSTLRRALLVVTARY
jgi:hypothetical protein